jgi:hypothetical protein
MKGKKKQSGESGKESFHHFFDRDKSFSILPNMAKVSGTTEYQLVCTGKRLTYCQ